MEVAGIREQLHRRTKAMLDIRESWKPFWRDVRDYMLPDHGYMLDDSDGNKMNEGDQRDDKIFNSTATDALDVLSAGLLSNLTSPARPWIKLVPDDIGLMNYGPAKEYLSMVEKQMFFVFAKSNVYNALHHTDLELGGFCTGAMAVLETFNTVIRCRPFTAGEYALAMDHEGILDTFYRDIRMTARQMAQQFGENNLSQAVKTALERKPDTEFNVCQFIEPNDDKMNVRDAMGRKYRSIYYEKTCGEDKVLAVGGYDEFPIMAPRWTVTGNQIYGRGVGYKVLRDVKMLQEMEKQKLLALAKQVEPPMRAPGSLKNDNINSMPGGITYYDDADPKGLSPLYEVRMDLSQLAASIQVVENRIREGCYNDLFKMMANLDDRERTAREIAERHEEKLIMLGPVVTRMRSELLDPLIDRTYEIMHRMGILPPPPPELAGMNLNVEYVSPLAQAQKMVGAYGLEETVAFAGNLAAMDPNVLDVIDFEKALRFAADIKGVDPTIIRSPEEVAKRAQAKAQQQQQAMALAAAEQGAAAAKNAATAAATMADSNVNPSNTLATLLSNPTQ